jgi:hypothetical protein
MVESGTDGARSKPPTLRQQAILDEYVQRPNAAAVARALATNERHVRRLVEQFPDYLEDVRRRRDDERLERIRARQARVQDWADAVMEMALRRLDELASSDNHNVALRAIDKMLDLALPASSGVPLRVNTELDRALESRKGDLARRLDEIEATAVENGRPE